ncbi:hypothetical protein OROHE_019822 [Orobanche hederae]
MVLPLVDAPRSSKAIWIKILHQTTAPCETEVLDPSWVLDGESKLDYSRPDAILGSCWVEQKDSTSMLKGSTTNSVAAFLGDTSASTSTWAYTWAASSK